MKLSNTLKIAFRNIIKNKTRSFLTSLGIIIGVGSVIVMVGIGQGTQDNIKNQIESLGTNLIIVMPGNISSGGVNQGSGSFVRLTTDDYDALKTRTTYLQAISPIVRSNQQVIGGGNNWRTSITGVSADYQIIKSYQLSSGEFFTDQDVKVRKNYALIGPTVRDQLFPNQDPVGKALRIGQSPFKIIGLLQPKGKNATGIDQDDIVLIPYTTLMYKVSGGRYISFIYASAYSQDDLKNAQDEMTEILRETHKIHQGAANDFTVGNQTDIAQSASSVAALMTLLLGSIAAVSLVVGGIGIMNIMLVSVTERTREIGTRMAVGARGKDILLQFLIEAFVLSLSGGLIGILISCIASLTLNTFTTVNMALNINIILIAVLFSGSVGIFFGFYPARKASLLNPIDALRYE